MGWGKVRYQQLLSKQQKKVEGDVTSFEITNPLEVGPRGRGGPLPRP